MAEQIGIEEWLKEIERLSKDGAVGDGGNTTKELAEMLCISPKRVQTFIREGVLLGRIAVGRRKVLKDWDGKMRFYQVYRVVKEAKKKEGK